MDFEKISALKYTSTAKSLTHQVYYWKLVGQEVISYLESTTVNQAYQNLHSLASPPWLQKAVVEGFVHLVTGRPSFLLCADLPEPLPLGRSGPCSLPHLMSSLLPQVNSGGLNFGLLLGPCEEEKDVLYVSMRKE